jgi:hypothetical protein
MVDIVGDDRRGDCPAWRDRHLVGDVTRPTAGFDQSLGKTMQPPRGPGHQDICAMSHALHRVSRPTPAHNFERHAANVSE